MNYKHLIIGVAAIVCASWFPYLLALLGLPDADRKFALLVGLGGEVAAAALAVIMIGLDALLWRIEH